MVQTYGTVTGLDLLAGAVVLVVALLAWASLALAHLGRHSLPGALGLAARPAAGSPSARTCLVCCSLSAAPPWPRR